MKRILAVLTVGWLVLVQTSYGDRREVEVYSAGTADLDVFAASIRAVVGLGDTVVPDIKGHRVVVVAAPATHQVISSMAGKLVAPVRNIRVDVSISDVGEDDRTSIGVSGGGGVVIRDGDVDARIRLRPRLSSRRTEVSSRTRQSLMVSSGREAVLRVGESVPYLEWLEVYGLRGGYIQQRVAWQEVGSFLVVQPTALGDEGLIRVRLTPVLKGRVGGRPHQVRFAELATEVTVQDGHSVDLGGLDTNDEFYSRFLVGVDRSRATRRLAVTLTPTILGAGGRPVGP